MKTIQPLSSLTVGRPTPKNDKFEIMITRKFIKDFKESIANWDRATGQYLMTWKYQSQHIMKER